MKTTILVKNNDWQTKPIKVADKTKTILKNGRVIDSASAMLRKAYKSGR